jgi:hypothetical protein
MRLIVEMTDDHQYLELKKKDKIDWCKDSAADLSLWIMSKCMVKNKDDECEAIWHEKEFDLAHMACDVVCQIRDAGYLKLDLGVVFKALELESMLRLAEIEWVSDGFKSRVAKHAMSLPGFDSAKDFEEQSSHALEAHDVLRFGLEMSVKRALGMGFGDHPPITWERIPKTLAEKIAIEERCELQQWLERKPKKMHRRL